MRTTSNAIKLAAATALCGAAVFGATAIGPIMPAAQAKTVTTDGWYMGSLHQKSRYSMGLPEVWKISFAKTKVTTKGPLGYSKKKVRGFNTGLTRKSASRTFRLAKNVRYYDQGGDAGKARMSKKSFARLAQAYNGLSLTFRVKGGKVTEMLISS